MNSSSEQVESVRNQRSAAVQVLEIMKATTYRALQERTRCIRSGTRQSVPALVSNDGLCFSSPSGKPMCSLRISEGV